MKENNINFNFEINIEELTKKLEFLITQIGCSAEEVGKSIAKLSEKMSQIGISTDQFIAAGTTEKNEPLEIFDPIVLNEDCLFIIPNEETEGYIELWETES